MWRQTPAGAVLVFGDTPAYNVRNGLIDEYIADGRVHEEDEDCFGFTALHAAAAEGLPDVAVKLLAAGAALEARDRSGCTPLHAASNVAVAAVLVGAGAALEARDGTGSTPLLTAVARMDRDVVRFLLSAGADARACDDEGGILHAWAYHHGLALADLEVLDDVMVAGAAVDARDDAGETAAALLARHGCDVAADAILRSARWRGLRRTWLVLVNRRQAFVTK